MKLPVTVLAAALLLAGCGGPAPFPVPPPIPAEIVPLPPVSEGAIIWQPGDWAFAGGSYRYEAGRYVPAAGHGTSWMFGHWAPDGKAVAWVPGHWI